MCPLYPTETAHRASSFRPGDFGVEKPFAKARARYRKIPCTVIRAHDLVERSTWTANSRGNRCLRFVLLAGTRRCWDTDRLTNGYNFKRANVSKRISHWQGSNPCFVAYGSTTQRAEVVGNLRARTKLHASAPRIPSRSGRECHYVENVPKAGRDVLSQRLRDEKSESVWRGILSLPSGEAAGSFRASVSAWRSDRR
jgi:hypothetical protein